MRACEYRNDFAEAGRDAGALDGQGRADREGWLKQRSKAWKTAQKAILRDFSLPVVRIACRRCDRAGRYRLVGLVERFGPAAGLPDVLWALSADCPRRGVGQLAALRARAALIKG